MTTLKNTSMALLASSVILACSPSGDSTSSGSTQGNPLLAHAPADTPYVFANLEPVPANVIDAYLVRAEPFLAQAQIELDQVRSDMGHDDMSDESRAIAKAVLAELDGKLNKEGFESLGFSLQAYQAIYGNGIFPVMRFGLGDAQALRDTIARIEANSGQSIPEEQLNGVSYWKAADGDQDMAGYIAILDDHVAMTFAPPSMESEFLPALLGQEGPDESIASSGALEDLNDDKDYLAYGSGFMDVARMLNEFINPDSTTARYLAAADNYDVSELDPTCKAEAQLMAAVAPRMTAGTTELTENAVAASYQIEISPALAGEFTRLVADVPPASTDESKVGSASMNLWMGRVRELALEKANLLAENPFRCPQLQDLNSQMQELAMQLNQPMPPFIGNLKGFRAELTEMPERGMEMQTARGLFSLEVESPQMLVGMASMMMPGMEELQLEPGGDPVQLPEELMMIQTPDFEIHAVMSNDAIGFSMGKGLQEKLVPFMEEEGDADGVFFSFDYDMAAMMQIEDVAMEQYGREDVSYDSDGRRQAHQDLMKAYENMIGRNRMEFRFVDDGIVISNRMTFK